MSVSLIRFFPFIFMAIFSIAGINIINGVGSASLPYFNGRNLFIDFSLVIFLYLFLMSTYIYFTAASYYSKELLSFELKIFNAFEKLKLITLNKFAYGISIVLRVTMLKAFIYLSFFALFYYNKIVLNNLATNNINLINETISYFIKPIAFLIFIELFLGLFTKNKSSFNPAWYIPLFIVSAFGLPLFMIHSVDNMEYFVSEMTNPSQIRLIISGIILFSIYVIILISFKKNKLLNTILYFVFPALFAVGLHILLILYITSSYLIVI
jgi:hypothetical protein